MSRCPYLEWENHRFEAVDDGYYCKLTKHKVEKEEKEYKCEAYGDKYKECEIYKNS